jgi:hypothetical protein
MAKGKRGPGDWTKTAKARAKFMRTMAIRRQKQMDVIIGNLTEGSTITAACEAADVGATRTFYGWLREYPKFKKAVDAAMESRMKVMEDAVYATGVRGNVTAQFGWLKKHSEHWRKALCMSYVGGTGPDGAVPLKVDGLAGMIKAALAKEKTGEEDTGGQADTGRPGQAVHLPPAEGGPAGKV